MKKCAFSSIKKILKIFTFLTRCETKTKLTKSFEIKLVINVQSLCEPLHQLKKKDLCLSQVINKAIAENSFSYYLFFHFVLRRVIVKKTLLTRV